MSTKCQKHQFTIKYPIWFTCSLKFFWHLNITGPFWVFLMEKWHLNIIQNFLTEGGKTSNLTCYPQHPTNGTCSPNKITFTMSAWLTPKTPTKEAAQEPEMALRPKMDMQIKTKPD